MTFYPIPLFPQNQSSKTNGEQLSLPPYCVNTKPWARGSVSWHARLRTDENHTWSWRGRDCGLSTTRLPHTACFHTWLCMGGHKISYFWDSYRAIPWWDKAMASSCVFWKLSGSRVRLEPVVCVMGPQIHDHSWESLMATLTLLPNNILTQRTESSERKKKCGAGEYSIFPTVKNKMFVNVQGCCDPPAKLQEGSLCPSSWMEGIKINPRGSVWSGHCTIYTASPKKGHLGKEVPGEQAGWG